MSSEEAWDRFNAAIRARQFSDEQLAMLREARIEDGSDLLNLESCPVKGADRQVGARTTPMIEVGQPLIDQGTLAQVRALLDGDQGQMSRLAEEPEVSRLPEEEGQDRRTHISGG